MKRTVIILALFAAVLSGCASTRIDTPETEAWHKREAQRMSIEQDKKSLSW